MEDADLTYKNLPLAQQKLATAEQRYKRGTYASMREEQAQVTEINRLKRNVAKLGRYLPLVDEKKALDEKIKTSRQDLRVCECCNVNDASCVHLEDSLDHARLPGPPAERAFEDPRDPAGLHEAAQSSTAAEGGKASFSRAVRLRPLHLYRLAQAQRTCRPHCNPYPTRCLGPCEERVHIPDGDARQL